MVFGEGGEMVILLQSVNEEEVRMYLLRPAEENVENIAVLYSSAPSKLRVILVLAY